MERLRTLDTGGDRPGHGPEGSRSPRISEMVGSRRAAGELSAPLWLDSFPALAGPGQMP